jgi:hypothetical protein
LVSDCLLLPTNVIGSLQQGWPQVGWNVGFDQTMSTGAIQLQYPFYGSGLAIHGEVM